ncbi:phosphate propanoyltransferase [Desulfovibrio sp. OttesenSCG-928-G15]|nr:phosphate propanoyltransferase [Desulfovibrio sp. OttesenSCG-928-G15]
MNENAIREILDKVVRNVLADQCAAPAASPSFYPSSGSQAEPIPVELSARHVHLCEKDVQALFGAPLTHVRDLSQPGEFLCKERVRLIGPKGVIDNVAILGPARKASQVEISKTDARILGIDAPVRQSGDVAGSPGVILASEKGVTALDKGLIVASRHIHMTPQDAARMHVADGDLVSVRIESTRPLILDDVLVRVNPNFKLSMHIDFDEGNSAGWDKTVFGVLVGKGGRYDGLCRC